MRYLTWSGRSWFNRLAYVISFCVALAGIILLAKGNYDARNCENNYYDPCYAQYQANTYCKNYANSQCNLNGDHTITYVGAGLLAGGFLGCILFCFCGGAYGYGGYSGDVVVTTTTIPPQQQGIVMQQLPPQYYQQPPQYMQQPYSQPPPFNPQYGPAPGGYAAPPVTGYPVQGYPQGGPYKS